MCSCTIFLFHCRSFSPWWPPAFLIFLSHRPIKFSCFSSNEIGLRCFLIPHSSSFSVFHVNVHIKFRASLHDPVWPGWPGYWDEFRLGFMWEISARFPRWEKAKDLRGEFWRQSRETKQTKILTFAPVIAPETLKAVSLQLNGMHMKWKIQESTQDDAVRTARVHSAFLPVTGLNCSYGKIYSALTEISETEPACPFTGTHRKFCKGFRALHRSPVERVGPVPGLLRLGFIWEISARFPRWKKDKDPGDWVLEQNSRTEQTWPNAKVITFAPTIPLATLKAVPLQLHCKWGAYDVERHSRQCKTTPSESPEFITPSLRWPDWSVHMAKFSARLLRPGEPSQPALS